MPICGPNQSLSSDQVAQLMRNAGFPDSAIPTGVAIAQAESGFQTGNCNPNDPYGGSFGLWQINGSHFQGSTTMACAFDPQCSTNFTYQLSNGGQNWSAWGTFTSGLYKQYLNGASPTLTTGTGCQCAQGDTSEKILGKDMCKHTDATTGIVQYYTCGSTPAGGGIPGMDLTTALSYIIPWIKDPTRLLKLIFGVLLIGGAIFLVASPQGQIAQTLMKTARRVGVR